jgi:hypothetical protein
MPPEQINVLAEILKGKIEMNRRYSDFHVTANQDCGLMDYTAV